MMPAKPSFQFYPGDWTRDTRRLSPAAKGAWIDILCEMHWSSNRGQVTSDMVGYARMMGSTVDQAKDLINELKRREICDVESADGEITLTNRRMFREARASSADRQKRFREKGGGDPQRWTAIRVRILERDNYRCGYCERKATTVDHIIPKSKGGTEDFANLVACCAKCNHFKNLRTLEETDMSIRPEMLANLKSDGEVTPPSSSSSSSSSEKKKKTTKEKEDPGEGFEEFWLAFPKKKAREDAIRAWNKLSPDEELRAEILVELSKQKLWPDWAKEGGKYVPHAATWLNGKRWQDEQDADGTDGGDPWAAYGTE